MSVVNPSSSYQGEIPLAVLIVQVFLKFDSRARSIPLRDYVLGQSDRLVIPKTRPRAAR